MHRENLRRGGRIKSVLGALLAILTLLLVPVLPTYAWWGGGHMVIAIIAYRELKPATRAQVDAILKAHPDYNNWLKEIPAGVSADDRAAYLFAIAATWPDRIKSQRDTSVTIKFHRGARGGADTGPTDPHYPTLVVHDEWHYVDIPIDADGKAHPLVTDDTALSAIPLSRDGLAKTDQPMSYRAYYLAWLEHLVGDVHQPLHATSRYSAVYPDGDRGGNSVHLQSSGRDEPNNLHSYWDGLLGDGGGTEYPTDWKALEATIAAVKADEPKELAGIDPPTRDDVKPEDWVHESYVYDQTFVYSFGPDATGPIPQPDAAYHEIALGIAHQRAALAGHRLALVIEGALAPH